MNILYAAPMRLPTEKAHGIQIMETCAALAEAGATVELAVTRLRTDDPFSAYGIRKGLFSIRKLTSIETVRYGRIGFAVHALAYAIQIVRRARKISPDVIYTRDPLCAIVTALFSTTPTVWEVHSEHPRVPRFILRRVAAVISITRGLSETYIRRGVARHRVTIAPDAVSLEAFEYAIRGKDRKTMRKKFGMREGRPLALYTGSFRSYSWKGVDVVEAAARLAPDIDWAIAGGSPEECEVMRREAHENVLVISRVGRSVMPLLLYTADVLLLPNKKGNVASERDTSPMKLFEYMAMRIPIVASDLPSVREVLTDESAYFAEPNDPESLVKTVREAISDAAGSRQKASRARADVEQYTWHSRASTILDALRRIKGKHHTPRVLILAESLTGRSGWGRYAKDLTDELVRSGASVTVVCQKITPDSSLEQLDILPMPLQSKRILAFGFLYARTIKSRLRGRQFDAVHCLVEPYAPVADRLARTFHAPLFITCHGTYAVRPLRGVFGIAQTAAYRHAKAIVCVSRYTQSRLLEKVRDVRTVVIPNGLALPPLNTVVDAKEHRIIAVGAIKARKGYDAIIESLERIAREVRDVQLTIVGNQDDAEYVKELEARAAQLGVDTRIKWCTNISDAKLQEYYAASKVFLLPSANVGDAFEGFGLVYLEANAHGLPAIGSKDTGAEDAIEDGVSGYLVGQGDVAGIAEKVTALLTDDALWRRMSAAAKQRADTMQWRTIVKRYLQLYSAKA